MNPLRILNHVFMAEEGDGAGGGAGTGTDTTATTETNAGGSGGADGANPGGSVLASVAPPAHERFAEKFRVQKEDGTFDLEQTAFKQAEAYAQLEKRFGGSEPPPKTAAEYTFDKLPEGVTAAEVLADPMTQAFLGKVHELGINNAQMQEIFNFAMSEWAPALMEGNAAISEQECADELKGLWKNEGDFKTNTTAAHRALQSFAQPGEGPGSFNRMMQKYGNDPDFIAFAANIGRELKEDTTVQEGQILGNQTLDELMKSEAYTNPKHKDHAAVSEKVRRYYAAKHPGIVQ